MAKDINEQYVKEFLKKMPKVELHAHLNGSLSQMTLDKLISLKSKKENTEKFVGFNLPRSAPSSLSQCFDVFKLIHEITDSPEAIYIATCDVIEDFNNDGVQYLEIRSTPREVIGTMNRSTYVQTILSAIENCKSKFPDITVKLILAIDRRNSIDVAKETIKIAEEHMNSTAVVGIDLSGDPLAGNIHDFLPVLQRAKKAGLKLALHIAETPNRDDEVSELLDVEPDRIGHGTFLHPENGGSKANFSVLQQKRIPLELCLTSNVICKTVPSYKEHHLSLWRQIDYPFALCTDDKGVFNTTLSEEYYQARKYFSLTEEDMWKISRNSIEYCFMDTQEKALLLEVWAKKEKELFQSVVK